MSGGANVVCLAGSEWPPVERAIGLDVTARVAESLADVQESVADGSVDCVLAGSDLPDRSAADVLRTVRKVDSQLPVVLWPDAVDSSVATAAVRHDATEYLPGATAESVAERLASTLENTEPSVLAGIDAFSDGLPDALFVLDDSGSIVYASEATRDVFGYWPDELEGEELDCVVSDDLEHHCNGPFVSSVEDGDPIDDQTRDGVSIEVPVVDADGEEFAAAVSLGQFVLGGDRYVGVTVRSVADQKRRERALTALHESSRRLMDAQDHDAVAEIAVDTADDVLGMPVNTVFLRDEATDLLEPIAWTDEAEAVLGDQPSLSIEDSLAGEAFSQGEPAVYGDLDAEQGRHNPETPLESDMLLPLGDHGVLAVGDTEAGAFDDVDESLGRIYAANVEAALSRAAREQTLWRYRAAIENVQDLVFAMDDDGRIALVTDRLVDLLGYERRELVGSSIDTMLTEAGIEEGVVLVNHLLAGESGSRARYETILEPADGDPVPVQIELSLMEGETAFEGVVGVVRDRSEIEQTREELATARERFTDLFEHIPDAVVEAEFIDGEPVVRSVNPAFEDVFGYAPDDVVGSSLNDFVLTDDVRDSGEAIDTRVMEGTVTTARVRRKTADGFRDFLFRGIPYDSAGESGRGFAIYTDITEQTERERRLGVLTNVLRHNLRTEMNLVLAHANSIIRADPDEEAATLAEELRESAETVVQLGETARDLEALIERTWGTGSSIDLVALTRSVTDELASGYPSATVRTELPESALVVGDEALRRALFELLENAIVHARDEPTVEVTVEPANDEWVELKIVDDGPGIPAFERELLAGKREVTQLQHGSGLGLWIAQWTIESLGGTLTLLDRDPTGTVARVRLRRG